MAPAVLGIAGAAAQTQDNSGNHLLNGSFRFRYVAVQSVDSKYNPTDITATYGAISFDGAGNYTIAGTSVDNGVSSGAPKPLNLSGTYAIGANGAGYITNPLYPADFNAYIYGAVAQGVYTGSSTESQGDNNTLNDIFVAIPIGPPPTNATFASSWQTGLLDFPEAGSSAVRNALFELSADGKGGFGPIAVTGQAAGQTGSLTQSITGATYNFSGDGSATLTIPLPTGVSAASALFTGSKTMFESADGNFILGWTATGYDIFFGVRALTVSGTNSLGKGLYFTAALEDSPAGPGTDSYYGGTSNTGDSAGDGVVHQRLNLPLTSSQDYGSDDQIALNTDGTTGADFLGYQYIFGDGGLAFVAVGSNGNFALVVGMHAPAFSGTGVYLNPVGVTNAASFQPITASLAPGELIALFGTGLSSTTMSMLGGQAFPLTLGGVSVTINNLPCPIYYVSPTQLSVIVPYAVASNQTGLANIQVTSNQVPSNVVQMYLTDAAPAAFAQNQNGIGLAAALHGTNYQPITPNAPAQAGETISLFMTGLGTVTPGITDGAVTPLSPLSLSDVYSAGHLTVYFNDYGSGGTTGNSGNIQFAGLVPTLAGLYQINVQVPATGLASGDNVYVEFVTDAADVNQIQIPYGAPAVTALSTTAQPMARAARIGEMRAHGRKAAARRARGAVPATDSRP